MKVEVGPTAEEAAAAAAACVAEQLRAAIERRGHATFAVSGGKSPVPMFAALARSTVEWNVVDILQVDERIAPAASTDRNATSLRQALLDPARIPEERVHLMPVEAADLGQAAADYGRVVERLAGAPPRIDVIHLGLGSDGHTASLIPGDPVLAETSAAVALTGAYQGRRRMTLTYPVLSNARSIVWLITGADKAEALRRLRAGDHSIPGGRVEQRHAVAFADAAAVE